MDKLQRAKALLIEIEALRAHQEGIIPLLTLLNEMFKDAEALAKEVLETKNDDKAA